MEIPYRAFPEQVGPRIASLESVDYLKQVITSVVEKKNNLNEQNLEVYWKARIEDRASGIQDRFKNLK